MRRPQQSLDNPPEFDGLGDKVKPFKPAGDLIPFRIRREDERCIAPKQFVGDGKRVFGVELDVEYGGIHLIGGDKGECCISARHRAEHECSGLLESVPRIGFQKRAFLNDEDVFACEAANHNLFLLGILTQVMTGS